VTISTDRGERWSSTLQVVPDPHFPIAAADRAAREAMLLRAYTLQRELVEARTTARSLAGQLASIREQLNHGGDPGRSALPLVERAAADVARVQGQATSTIAAAGRAQGAIDGYAGLPTAAQLRELESAWTDGLAAVGALNDVILHQMPAIYATTGGSSKWPEVKPLAGLTKP
jgi:hypothetical protein